MTKEWWENEPDRNQVIEMGWMKTITTQLMTTKATADDLIPQYRDALIELREAIDRVIPRGT